MTPLTAERVGPYGDAAELERRPDRHGGVSHLTAIDGTLIAATDWRFLAAAAREVAATLDLRDTP